jgi:amidase
MNKTSAVFSNATDLARLIRTRETSAREVFDAHVEQINRHNTDINAIVTFDLERAAERAQAADDALARGELWGPLHGVPFTLKDAHATAGVRNTLGFPAFDHVPTKDGTVASRLKNAGAILMGKTNVATLLADYQTNNPIFGRTNNPWNRDRTSGGSSGGAAAAIASGMTPFDVGTDLSNSIRLPAHFCGIAGLKPTENRISLHGVFPLPFESPRPIRIMSCAGPMARSVCDLAMLYGILAGPDGIDTDVNPVPAEEVYETKLKGVRIAVAPNLGGFPVAEEIRNAVQKFAEQLASRGAIVDQPSLPRVEFYNDLARAGELIEMMTGAFAPDAPPATLKQYLTALAKRDESITLWERFFDDWEVLIAPVSMTTAFPHTEPGSPLRVNDRDENYFTVSAHGTIWNYTGHPAVVFPCALDRDGLPIGVQLIARRWNESRLLAIADAIATSQNFNAKPNVGIRPK